MYYKNPVLKVISNGFLVTADCYEKSLTKDEYSSDKYLRAEEVYFKSEEQDEAVAKLMEFAKGAGIVHGTTTKKSKTESYE